MSILIWVLIGIVVIVLLFIMAVYNSVIRLKNRVENAWSQIDVQLKRRANVIPNIVNAVKGYMKHEKSVLEGVTKARTSLMSAGSVKEKSKANGELAGALKTLFAVAENYPDLKASENFKQLQNEIVGTEDKISYARQFYNDEVRRFNTKIQVFPSNVVAKSMGFTEKDYFEADEASKKPVKVEF
jgi:LemA protein